MNRCASLVGWYKSLHVDGKGTPMKITNAFIGLFLLLGASVANGSTPHDLYCIVDVFGGPQAAYYPVSYTNVIPGRCWSDDYKTSKIVLKKVVVDSKESTRVGPRSYYLGVFEITQSQYEMVTGRNPSSCLGGMRPVENLGRDEVARMLAAADLSLKEEDERSFLGLLRLKTGLPFDLPTCEQWECASAPVPTEGELMFESRFQDNSGDRRGGFPMHTTVGSYCPNRLGFYDLYGNVAEWCRRSAERVEISAEGGEMREGAGVMAGWICGGDWHSRYGGFKDEERVKQKVHEKELAFRASVGFRMSLPVGCHRKLRHHPYCVIDLTGGIEASVHAVEYLDEVPVGGWGNEHRTSKLVLRRIESGKFKYLGRHDVVIPRPFYIGIFEVTCQQYYLMTGKKAKDFKADRPVRDVAWEWIRGEIAENGVEGNWPLSLKISRGSALGRLSRKTGMHFDLPTEAQWEYVCKAGTTTRYNVGVDDDGQALSLCGVNRHGSGDWSLLPVGSKMPNRWGVYDMHGGVQEWCLDRPARDEDQEDSVLWYSPGFKRGSISSFRDEPSLTRGYARMARGGHYRAEPRACTSESRRPYILESDVEDYGDIQELGFRIVMEESRNPLPYFKACPD